MSEGKGQETSTEAVGDGGDAAAAVGHVVHVKGERLGVVVADRVQRIVATSEGQKGMRVWGEMGRQAVAVVVAVWMADAREMGSGGNLEEGGTRVLRVVKVPAFA